MIGKGEFFSSQDRYLYEPFEEAMFFWDHKEEQVYMKLPGWTFSTPVDQDHRIFNDAILSGFEISKEELDSGQLVQR